MDSSKYVPFNLQEAKKQEDAFFLEAGFNDGYADYSKGVRPVTVDDLAMHRLSYAQAYIKGWITAKTVYMQRN